MTGPTLLRSLATAGAILAAGAALATGLKTGLATGVATELATDVATDLATGPATGPARAPAALPDGAVRPVLVGGSGLDGVVPGSALGVSDPFNWLPGHLARFHNPLRFYP